MPQSRHRRKGQDRPRSHVGQGWQDAVDPVVRERNARRRSRQARLVALRASRQLWLGVNRASSEIRVAEGLLAPSVGPWIQLMALASPQRRAGW